jgi:uncharacterized membrane protein YfbV (UPF0208 family)
MQFRGDKTWPFALEFNGELLATDVVATWFGGANDPEDSGQTASGYPTKGHPELLGCSLPMDFGDKVPSTKGSPVPRMPFGLMGNGDINTGGAFVEVWPVDHRENAIFVPVIDIGPAKSATRNPHSPKAIDLTVAAFTKLGGKLSDGNMRVSYRIVNFDAEFVPGGIKQSTLNEINQKIDIIMATQAEAAAQLATITSQLVKANTEIQARIQALIDAAANVDLTPELQAAVDGLKPAAQALDDIVPDQPTTP